MQFTILFSPTARVYNLRFLLVVTVAALVWWVRQLALGGHDAWFGFEFVILGIVSCAVITVHQLISLLGKCNSFCVTWFHLCVACLRGAYVVWLQLI
jgi:hypothetical protein